MFTELAGKPISAHATPVPADADLSLPGIVTSVTEYVTDLDLHQATLVCSDRAPRNSSSARGARIVSPIWSWSPARFSTTSDSPAQATVAP